MTISLNDIRIYAYHGVLPFERKEGAWYRVSIDIDADCQKAMETDSIEDTVNYAEVARIIEEEMKIPSNLLEHVSGRIIKRLMDELSSIDKATITVHKEHPPIDLECASSCVTIIMKRDT